MNLKREKKIRLSIVIPVYNSQDTIGRLVDQLVQSLSKDYKLEIILINDKSSDDSEQICTDIFYKYDKIVKFYTLAKNVGEHNAVMAGLNNASGDYIVIIDDDFQNPISEVIKLVRYAEENQHDVVYTYYPRKEHSVLRNLGSNFNDKVANIMLKKPKDLYLSSFKLFNKFILGEVIKYDHPFPYLDGLILRTTSNIGKIQVVHVKREAGESGYTLTKLIRLWLNMFTSFSIFPLRASIIIGFIFAVIGFSMAIYVFIDKMVNPNLPAGYATLMVVISIFAGIQLMAIGLVGEYLGRVLLSLNKKPQFTIRKRFEK